MLVVLLASVMFAVSPGVSQAGNRTREEMLQQIRGNLAVDRNYVPGTKAQLVLGLNEAGRLKLASNAAQITEVLFQYGADGVRVIYGYVGESHSWAMPKPEGGVEWRITRSHGAPAHMHCTTEWKLLDGKAHVTFISKPMSDKQVADFMKRQREEEMRKLRKKLEWDEGGKIAPIRLNMPHPSDPDLATLRTQYELDKVVAGASNDYERLQRLVKWVHDRWRHDGNNTPSNPDPLTILAEAAEGKRFRCVEYATVLTACAQAMGMPARKLALKRQDVETAEHSAGHLVTEVWLASHKKWVFADGQMDAIPEKDGVPLNAVEFQEAFATRAPGLKIRSSSKMDADAYIAWVVPYLYYFDFNTDQQQFRGPNDRSKNQPSSGQKASQPPSEKIMLGPKDAKKPTVFQRKSPIGDCTYISNPKAFYPAPTLMPAQRIP